MAQIDAEQRPDRLAQADVRPIGKGRYRLYQKGGYTYHRVTHFTVPEGFVCDLASIPWWIQWLIPKGGLEEVAALIHNWRYKHAGDGKACGGDDYTRIESDLEWYWNVLWAGCPTWRAWLVFRGVRWGGRKAWRAHARRIALEADLKQILAEIDGEAADG